MKIPIREIAPKPPCDFDFENFWKSYPRKAGKGAAKKSFEAAMKKTTPEKILSAIEVQKQSRQWTSDDGRFIPHPATWLNQQRWDDELETGRHDDEQHGQHGNAGNAGTVKRAGGYIPPVPDGRGGYGLNFGKYDGIGAVGEPPPEA